LSEGVGLGLDPETAAAAATRYGSTVDKLYDILRSRPDLAERVDPDLPFSEAEIIHGAKYEMALTLEDLLRRRIPLLILNPPSEDTLRKATSLAAPVLDWTPKRCVDEVQSVIKKYRRET
jgi:glycerol-3-phosphate dehydrogenase